MLLSILPKFDVIEPNIEAIAHFFPFISTPFMMVAWFMAIKMTGELLKRNSPQYVAIIYFVLLTIGFFIYGLAIKKMPEFDLATAHDDLYTKFKITKREREIINEICKGKTNKQIAEELFISLQTVKDHTHNIFTKTGLRNRVQLARKFS